MRVQILDGRYTRRNPRLQDGVWRVVFPATRYRVAVARIFGVVGMVIYGDSGYRLARLHPYSINI